MVVVGVMEDKGFVAIDKFNKLFILMSMVSKFDGRIQTQFPLFVFGPKTCKHVKPLYFILSMKVTMYYDFIIVENLNKRQKRDQNFHHLNSHSTR